MNDLMTRFSTCLMLLALSGLATGSDSTIALDEEALDRVTAGGTLAAGLEVFEPGGAFYGVMHEGVFVPYPEAATVLTEGLTASSAALFKLSIGLAPRPVLALPAETCGNACNPTAGYTHSSGSGNLASQIFARKFAVR